MAAGTPSVTLTKTEDADKVTYVTDNGLTVVVYKEDRFRLEIATSWAILQNGRYKSWQEYAADVEAGNTVV